MRTTALLRDSNNGHSNLSIFSQDWWIRIARGSSDYRELTVARGDNIVGRLPLVFSKNWLGLVRVHDPHWSHLGGPVVDETLSRSDQVEVVHSLLRQLPRWASFSFVCDPNLRYADLVRNAFREAGFEHSPQVTYVRHPADGDVLTTRKAKHRGHFKRAAKSLECVELTAKEFVQFFKSNLKARRRKTYAPLETLATLIEEAVTRGCARVIAARPLSGSQSDVDCGRLSNDAAIVYVWDHTRCYYWLSTHRVPSPKNSLAKPHPDAIKFLAQKMMEHAQAMNLIFDADGVVNAGVDNLYRNIFGLREELRRDVFQRINPLEHLYQRFRRRFQTTLAMSRSTEPS